MGLGRTDDLKLDDIAPQIKSYICGQDNMGLFCLFCFILFAAIKHLKVIMSIFQCSLHELHGLKHLICRSTGCLCREILNGRYKYYIIRMKNVNVLKDY